MPGPLRAALVLALIVGASGLACGGEEDGGGDTPIERTPAPANPAYAPPADRIDPAVAATSTFAALAALGEARSGPDANAAPPATTLSRYVSAQAGDDAQDGSEANPWRTLQHAADTVDPDTTVYVEAGDYEGGIVITRGGDTDRWVVFTARDTSNPPRLLGGMDRDAVVAIDASWVTIHGLEIASHDRGDLRSDEIGINVEPESADISHIRLLDNHIHHIGPPDTGGKSCSYNAHGLIAQSKGYRIANLIIDGNELHDLYVGNSECLVVNGLVEQFQVTRNYVHDVNNIAIDIIGYEKSSRETTRFGLVADNVVLDASNYWPYCTRGNCTYPEGDESSDGIYVDGGAGLDIAYNVVGRTDHGIELQSENGELIRDVEVHHNLVFNSNYEQLTIGASENVTERDNVLVDEPTLANTTLEGCK
ncbi:MAG: hypothetical protein H6746_19120 [Deltaproteobacteria bacterium]|nr:hypothetical protein [Deltaproteobacteria bacterium]